MAKALHPSSVSIWLAQDSTVKIQLYLHRCHPVFALDSKYVPFFSAVLGCCHWNGADSASLLGSCLGLAAHKASTLELWGSSSVWLEPHSTLEIQLPSAQLPPFFCAPLFSAVLSLLLLASIGFRWCVAGN
jgi:hypothetical protein